MVSESSFETKEQIKRAINIVDLVGQYLQLRREGRAYKALCPWHDDTRPSLQVNQERQSFKCWVCDIGGDIFSFLMKMENISFPEALAMLAERAGIPLQKNRSAVGAADDRQLLYQAMAWAEQQYHDQLLKSPAAQQARTYLEQRGITSDSISRFRLGYAPEDWEWLAARAGNRFGLKTLEAAGLISKRPSGPGYYDRFRGRLLFSIRDTQGRCVAFGGRVLPGAKDDNAAKYVNSPETPLFSKSNLVYGLDFARSAIVESHTAIVMEGYTDCLIAQQAGIPNAVAVLGTAFGERHLKLLRRYADRVVLVLDGDEAGRRRTDQLLELFISEPVDLRVLTLPDNQDPCDFILAHGPAAFTQLLAEADDALEHKFRSATRGITAQSSVHEANRALEDVLATLSKTSRLHGGASAGSLKEDQVLNRLATKFNVAEERIRSRLVALRKTARAPQRDRAPAEQPPIELDAWERELLEIAIQSAECLDRMREEIQADQLTSAAAQTILTQCYALAGSSHSLFDRLLVEFDDPQLKSLLVDLDERGRAKGSADLLLRLEQVLTSLRRRRDLAEQRQACAALAERRVDEQTELDILRKIIERERSRQGISVPTDG